MGTGPAVVKGKAAVWPGPGLARMLGHTCRGNGGDREQSEERLRPMVAWRTGLK